MVSNHRAVFSEFGDTWLVVMKKFQVTMPLKDHIILHHLSDYMEFTGKTLFHVTYQVGEAVGQLPSYVPNQSCQLDCPWLGRAPDAGLKVSTGFWLFN